MAENNRLNNLILPLAIINIVAWILISGWDNVPTWIIIVGWLVLASRIYTRKRVIHHEGSKQQEVQK